MTTATAILPEKSRKRNQEVSIEELAQITVPEKHIPYNKVVTAFADCINKNAMSKFKIADTMIFLANGEDTMYCQMLLGMEGDTGEEDTPAIVFECSRKNVFNVTVYLGVVDPKGILQLCPDDVRVYKRSAEKADLVGLATSAVGQLIAKYGPLENLRNRLADTQLCPLFGKELIYDICLEHKLVPVRNIEEIHTLWIKEQTPTAYDLFWAVCASCDDMPWKTKIASLQKLYVWFNSQFPE